MAEKMIFLASSNTAFNEEIVTYKYYSGFAVSQKQKCIRSLHSEIELLHPGRKILEISTKSENDLGIKLSAFNLMFFHKELGKPIHIENVFQSSKVFSQGGPYRDLLHMSPKDAKRDERLHNSGSLTSFNLYGEEWPLKPTTLFYDWIYINALMDNKELAHGLLDYDIFTDIEFNHKKSLNCQARAAAIFVSLSKQGILLEKLKDPDSFKSIYNLPSEGVEQICMPGII